MLAPRPATSPSLTRYLREATRKSHDGVRMVPIIRAYFQGKLTAELLMEGLASLRHVYGALEGVLRDHESTRGLWVDDLARVPALERDLRELTELGLPSPQGPFPQAVAYADRIEWLAANDPGTVGAHAYARYMGDLVGGPIAAKVAPAVLPLPRGVRLHYLDLAKHPSLAELRVDFRARVDALPWERREILADEVRRAFALHKAMSGELWDRFVDGRPSA